MTDSIAAAARSTPQDSAARPLGLLALWLLATLGLHPLLVPDEGRYVGVARAMLLGGDWLVPRLDGLPFFHKPPLMYWIDAAAMSVLGINEFAARLAPAIGAWVMGAALYFALRRWHGVRAARTALVVLATTPMFFIGGQYANHDMVVAGFIAAAVFAFAEAAESGTRRAWQLGWLACALALLAKGLIGVVLPLVVVGPWLLARRRWRAIAAGLHPLAWLPGLVLAAPWFVAMQLRFPEFFDYFVIEQHFRRYTQTDFNNAQPWWFFVAVLPLLTLPWSLAAPRSLLRAWRERSGAAGHWLGLYAWWVAAIMLFFSLPVSKLVGYVLPVVAPWCVLIALGLDPAGRNWRIGAVLGAVTCLTVIGVLAVQAPKSTRPAGLALAAAHAPGDTVVFVDEMFYDLPFYARLDAPVLVASRWDDPAVRQVDNWRKELADAARFDASAARVLVPLDRLDALACGAGGSVWFVGKPGEHRDALAQVRGLVSVYSDRRVELQRAPRHACPR
ncbi:MAG TPA: glycosyltransferase family 39 protein [Ideonella sp.]|nr:glycosyltransferase family 39 protein [Ideonella sp.]